jgi:sugar lactone lactonase YvrE
MEYSRGANGLEIQTIKEPSGIRVIGSDGKLLTSWPLEITPQAVNVAPDGSIYAGGQGKIAKLDGKGNVLLTVDAPHLSELPPVPDIPAAEKAEESESEREAKQARIRELEEQMVPLQDTVREAVRAMEKNDGDKEANARLEKVLAEYAEVAEQLRALTMDPRQLAMRERASAMRKRAVNAIAATDRDVFVATPAANGFGYDVWRLDRQLRHPKKIVTRLRGCCGQMDIQARDGKLYVAENARHRVVCYDRDGNQLSAWGKQDRKGVEGFGSCCNPMNLRFGSDGTLYTSEASLGRIKRYTPDGKFLGLVGTVNVVPGCKHVAVAVSKDGSRAFMLDITRNQIAVMKRRDRDTQGPKREEAAPRRKRMRL